jgi:hypothetical protein
MVKAMKPVIKSGSKKKSSMPKLIQALVDKASKSKPKPLNFGPVATVNSAPVAIGNSVRGSKTQVISSARGVTVSGRDFAYTPVGTGSVTTWTLSGGTPLTPAAFSDSTLRQYMQMYQRFRWRKLIVHYITSSPTSSNGDVMFYHQKNRNSVFLNQTSSQLLPFVMSDSDTVIGPQWTNHSAELTINSSWKSTDYGMSSSVDDYAEGDIFLLSKTSTTDSPGYVIIDFIVDFAELQISPRLLSLPLPRAQWNQMNLGLTTTAVTTTTAISIATVGNGISGSASVLPTGCSNGDIYKLIIDLTNSTSGSWVNGTPANPVRVSEPGGANVGVTIVDGTTLYAIYNGTSFILYPNAETAFVGGGDYLTYGAASTISFNYQVWLSLIGTMSATNLNPNF